MPDFTTQTQYPDRSPSAAYANWLRFQHWGNQHPAYDPEPPRCTRCGSVTHRSTDHRPIAPDDACADYQCSVIHPGVDHTAYLQKFMDV